MKHTNRWDIPKGHVDAGESYLQCAARELQEETNIHPAQIRHIDGFQWQNDYVVFLPRYGNEGREKRLIVFLGLLLQPMEIVCTEHPGYAWLRWAPPHQIQTQTIDPLLSAVAEFFKSCRTVPL